jgi:hypothetical protein
MIVLGSAFFLLSGVSGCASESHDSLVKKIVEITKDVGATMAKIQKKTKDGEIDKQIDRLKKLAQDLRKVNQQIKELKEPPDSEEREKLATKNDNRKNLLAAMNKVNKEWNRIKNEVPRASAKIEKDVLPAFTQLD